MEKLKEIAGFLILAIRELIQRLSGALNGAGKKDQSSSSGKRKRKRRQKYTTAFYFQAMLIYLEVMFHLLAFHKPSIYMILPILFAIPGGMFLGMLCSLFNKRINTLLTKIITVILCILFIAELIYYNVFDTFFNLFGVLGVAGQALDFTSVIFKTILQCILAVVLLLLPAFFILRFGRKYVSRRRYPLKRQAMTLVLVLVMHIICLLVVIIGPHSMYSKYDVYFHNVSVDKTIEQFGVFTSNRLWLKYFIFGAPKATLTAADPDADAKKDAEKDKSDDFDTSPNVLDIDFDKILAGTSNKEVESLVEYFKSASGTNKNKYTGMFEGYNVIWITAEGLDKYLLSAEPDMFPTLNKMMNEGFVFNHYYSPLWYGSTSGGEFANLTGLVPNNGSYVSMEKSGEIGLDMYFTIGRALGTRQGFAANGYHNNDYKYYSRNTSFPNMGYNWHGTGQGYEPEKSEATGRDLWPQSDIQLIDQSFDDFKDEENGFLTYYMSVSGHLLYTFEGNAMARKNRDKVENLDYSEGVQAYISCNLELEYAMEDLLQKLEESGLSDNTLIVLAPDHIPYDNKEIIDELAGSTQSDPIDWTANCLAIYSPGMEEPIPVDKYCSSIDILPTVLNLLGLDYDSRMMCGSDILSDSPQFIFFPGLSFISDKCIYNAETEEVKLLTDEQVDDTYIKQMKSKGYNFYTISDMIFDTDFYALIDKDSDKYIKGCNNTEEKKVTPKKKGKTKKTSNGESADNGENTDSDNNTDSADNADSNTAGADNSDQ